MKPREFDPLHLDVAVLARQGAGLEGSWPLTTLERLAQSAHPEAAPAPNDLVTWSARGERRARAGSVDEIWVHLRAQAMLSLECQRCLAPLPTLLQVDRWLRFVSGEAQAAALDEESEEDVLALGRSLDLRELVEDELLLALPLVPRHEVCPQPLPVAAGEPLPAQDSEQPHPFAALQVLRKPEGGH